MRPINRPTDTNLRPARYAPTGRPIPPPAEQSMYLVAHYHTGLTSTPDGWYQYTDEPGLNNMLNTVRGNVSVDWYYYMP